jgi:RHS repeat-associated protein
MRGLGLAGRIGTGLMVLVVCSAPSSTASTAPVGAQSDSKAPVLGPEVASLRTQTSRTFANSDGTLTAQIYSGSVNYRAADGRWLPIDNSMVKTATGFHNAAGVYEATLPRTLAGAVRLTHGTDWVSAKLRGAVGVGQANGTSVTYRGVLRGVDATYTATNDQLKEALTLRSATAARQFSFDLQASPGLTPKLMTSGGIQLLDAAHEPRLSLAAPSMTDAHGAATVKLAQTLQQTSRGWRLTITPDTAWLNQPSRAWPVTVDPSTNALSNPDCGLNQDTPTTSSCSDQSFYLGKDSSGNDHRAVLYFPIKQDLPFDAEVLSGTLQLNLYSQTAPASSPTDMQVYKVTRSWSPSASWNYHDGSDRWASPGGDYADGSVNDINVGGTSNLGKYWWGVTALTQGWEQGQPNYGLMVKTLDHSSPPANEMTFDSHESTRTGAILPLIDVRYTRRLGYQRGYALQNFNLNDHMSVQVNPANGNLVLRQRDLAVPDGLGPDLNIARSYNSYTPGPANPSYGNGWRIDTASGISLQDHGGNSHEYLTLPGGAMVNFEHKWNNNIHANDFVSPPGIDAHLSTDSDGGHTLTWNKSQDAWKFENAGSDQTARLMSITDRNGRKLTFNYTTGTFRVSSIVDAESRTTSFTWDTTNNRITQMTDSAGRTYGYGYNSAGLLSTYTDPQNGTTNQTQYFYDSENRLNKVVTPGGRITLITYFADTDPDAGKVNTVTQVTNTTDNSGPTTTFKYTERRDGSSDGYVTDPEGHETKYVFDTLSRVTDITDPLGNKQSTSYVTSTGQDDSNVVTYTPPGASGSTSSTAPGNASYDSLNNLTSTTFAVGSRVIKNQTTYPAPPTSTLPTGANYLPTSSRDEQGLKSSYTFDGSGNLTDEGSYDSSDALASTLHLNYGDSTSPGKVTSSTDGRNHTTAYFYDTSGNLTSIQPYSTPTGGQPTGTSVTAELGQTTISYSGHSGADQALSRPTSITLPGAKSKTFDYDNLDRVTKITYSDGSHVDYTYDADGNLTQIADSANGTRTFGYDNLNRMTSQSGPGTYALTYSYDLNGNLSRFTDPNGTTEYGYDAANHLLAVYLPGQTTPVKYTVDAQGNRLRIDWPNGDTTKQSFDAANEMTDTCVEPTSTTTQGTTDDCPQHTGRLLDFQYTYAPFTYPDGNSTAAQKGLIDTAIDKDGNISQYCYGTLNELSLVDVVSSGHTPSCTAGAHPTGETAYWHYVYDNAGNITQRQANGASDENYAYNSANELCWKLVGATGTDCSTNPTGAETFTYEGDGAGHTTGNESAEGGTGANRLTSHYDPRDQLDQFTVGTTTTNLSYFGDSQDDLFTVGSTTYRNTILGLTQIGTDTYTRDNAGGLVAQTTANGLQFVHTDALGSVRATTGTTGSVANRFDYDPYGRSLSGTGLSSPGASTSRFGYAGGNWIDAGSFYHFGARYYDPALQRWTMPDPVLQPTDPGQANLYGYVGGDPVNGVDPEGTKGGPGVGCDVHRSVCNRRIQYSRTHNGWVPDVTCSDVGAGVGGVAGAWLGDGIASKPFSYGLGAFGSWLGSKAC